MSASWFKLRFMLELQDLDYAPATAPGLLLSGIGLKAEPGKPVLVAGASGSGKTSLLEVIAGLSRQQRGTIRWNGQVLNQRQRRWLSGMVFQFPERHFLGVTVAQELRLGHRRLGTDEQQAVLQRVGLATIRTSDAPESLSGGQQRRLALAVQLLRGAELLLLDEPTAGLDWSVREDVLALLSDLSRERVLIVVTHEPQLFAGWDCRRHELINGGLKSLSTLPAA